MIELPEAKVIAAQIDQTLKGKKITNVIAGHTPHKFAWYFGSPDEYDELLSGKVIGNTQNLGGLIEISVENCIILLGDGVKLRYFSKNEKLPLKHQLLITFDDGSSISSTVQMYGGMWCFKRGENHNPYYEAAKEKPSPYSEAFDEDYFMNLLKSCAKNLSVKAFLATEQRIPGLGNGVLQDILWNAQLHPKAKINSLSSQQLSVLFSSAKSILKKMAEKGGRDTEKDIFDAEGSYNTIMSSKNVGNPCPACGEIIKKENYLGGSIYYCSNCQRI